MNVFRILGDVSHLLAIIILLLKILKSKSCAGECSHALGKEGGGAALGGWLGKGCKENGYWKGWQKPTQAGSPLQRALQRKASSSSGRSPCQDERAALEGCDVARRTASGR